MLALDSFNIASALAIEALALLKLACNGAGSISKSTWPSLTFEPSSKSRFKRIPVARARTWASRTELIRPGSSVVRLTRSGATVTTETSGGGGAGAFASLFPQAVSHRVIDSVRMGADILRSIEFMKIVTIRRHGTRPRQRRSVFGFALQHPRPAPNPGGICPWSKANDAARRM